MGITEEFAAYYNAQLKGSVTLPLRITSGYLVNACLKSTEEKEIYLITSKDTEEQYIVRRLPISASQANRAEYSLLKSLDHPRIPRSVDLFEEGGFSYLIRSYVRGISLHQFVETRGTVTEREATNIIIQLCDILAYLHMQQPPVIHRDIKPQNIILDSNGTVYLIDFDISRKFNPESTKDTMFIGTSATAPPEQYGYAQTDARSDVYSLGILMIFLYTGRYERSAFREIPPWLSKIAETCTQFAPRDRYASASLLKKAILSHKYSLPRKIALGLAALCCIAGAFYFGRIFVGKTAITPPMTSDPAATVEVTGRLPSIAQDGTVAFASNYIEELVRSKLGKKAGEPVALKELQSITELSAVGDLAEKRSLPIEFHNDQVYHNGKLLARGEINSLSDLSLMTGLADLTLAYQRIDDIKPLQNLHLKSLTLVGNYISDIGPLSNIQTLQHLNINNNPISDLSPLEALERLRKISIQQCSVTDISPLGKIPSLTSVDMRGTPCLDYSPLLSLPLLSSVDLSESYARDVAVVSGCISIKELIADECGIVSIDIIKSLPYLEKLELCNNDISDLSGIEKFQNLEVLSIRDTRIDDLKALTELSKLQELDLRGLNVDLSPLLSIPSLQKIICSPGMQPEVEKIKDRAVFDIEIIPH